MGSLTIYSQHMGLLVVISALKQWQDVLIALKKNHELKFWRAVDKGHTFSH